jgi:hypothetical protein
MSRIRYPKNNRNKERSKHIAFMILEGLFITAVILLPKVELQPWQFALLALATFRMARTLSFNEIAEPLRSPFTVTIPDSCKAGSNVHPKPGSRGIIYAVGSLLACPICTGQWSALILYASLVLVYNIGIKLVMILALAGASEILHYITCSIEWKARSDRVAAGSISPDR